MTSTGTFEMQLDTVLPSGSSGKWLLLLSPVDGGRNTTIELMHQVFDFLETGYDLHTGRV